MITQFTDFKNDLWHVTMSRAGVTVTHKSEDKQIALDCCFADLNEKLKDTHAPIGA